MTLQWSIKTRHNIKRSPNKKEKPMEVSFQMKMRQIKKVIKNKTK